MDTLVVKVYFLQGAVTLYSVSTLLLVARSRIQQCCCKREGFEYEETTEIILSIFVSNYIVTTSLLDGWPKIDERILVIWNTLLLSLFSAVTIDIIFLHSWQLFSRKQHLYWMQIFHSVRQIVYGLEDRRTGIRFPTVRSSSLSTVLRPTLHHTRPRILWLKVAICSGMKRTQREADRSLVASGDVKNEQNYTSSNFRTEYIAVSLDSYLHTPQSNYDTGTNVSCSNVAQKSMPIVTT